ncbi:SnoaL-like domain-containing protein [Podospora conica]|nr:SnoaL-like domain-containing protein [Schizothecium conicum]
MAAMFTSDGSVAWGNTSVKGSSAIEQWLRTDAGDMNGVQPGSVDTLVLATPLVNLAADGQSAKCRFNGWRLQGDGKGGTRIQGGIYENEYTLAGDQWKISLLKYYALYEGDYAEGWRNVGRANFGTVPPFHYTTDEAGIPIPPLPEGSAIPTTNATGQDLKRRIDALNDEDDVRNLQHQFGYYLDRRMWTDAVELFAGSANFAIDNVGSFSGSDGVRRALETWMGPEGLSQGILNEHLLFDTVVSVRPATSDDPNANEETLADARGIEIALIGDSAKGTASWRLGYYQNSFVKRNGVWQMLNVTLAPLIVANYTSGWGHGGVAPRSTIVPRLLPHSGRAARHGARKAATTTLQPEQERELRRQLDRSAAYDGSENASNAYGFFIDWIDGAGCTAMAAVHAVEGHKASPFAGFYQTRERVLKACTASYGTSEQKTRSSISFHWRPQPVILVSTDGRSASVRARLLQPATERNNAGALRGGMYTDQTVLENGIWRLWSVTIDEFYWGISNWKAGWAGVKARPANATNPGPRDLVRQYPPDLLLTEIGDPRETGFQGGTGRYTAWPEILRMWFAYRNPVSGRVPNTTSDGYWPGCVPCQHRPAWSLTRNGWQEPPTGPTLVKLGAVVDATGRGLDVSVTVSAGPGEPVAGVVILEGTGIEARHALAAGAGGKLVVSVALPPSSRPPLKLTARFVGSEHLRPGQDTVEVPLAS